MGRYRGSLNVTKSAPRHHAVALDQLRDAVIDRVTRPKSGPFDLLVRDDVVALVRVLADRRLDKIEIGHLQLDALAELGLRQVRLGLVRVGQADIVDLALHPLEIADGVNKDSGHIADMDVVADEMRLEQHDGAPDRAAQKLSPS